MAWVSSHRMLATSIGLPDHSLFSILSPADIMPVLAACCACCLSAGVGAEVHAACCAARLAAVFAALSASASSAHRAALCLLLLTVSRALLEAVALSEGSWVLL